MISKKCKYAIHALVHMEKRPTDKFLTKDISEACRIPKKFLETILLDLKRAGVLASKQGKGGGYVLRKLPSEANLADVVRLFDGLSQLYPVLPLNFMNLVQNARTKKPVRYAMVEMLKADTLESLLRREAKLKLKKSR